MSEMTEMDRWLASEMKRMAKGSMDALARVKDGITCSYDAAFLYYIDNEPSDITTGDLRALIRECEAARALFATLQGGPAQIVYAPLERVKAELAAYYAARKGSE